MHRLIAAAACAIFLPAAAMAQDARIVPGGDPRVGATLIGQMGCGACHSIPGIPGAHGMVGPPLDNIADRLIIAGKLANTPDNMTAWLMSPQSIVPGNAMPNIGLDYGSARAIAAYLYTLR
jgi:cytochrome c2